MSNEGRNEGEQIEIRLAVPNDAEAIAVVLLESFVEFKAIYTDEGIAATTVTSQNVLDRFREGPLWVAVSGGEIIGTASAVLKDETGDSLYVRGMAVLPSARGRGVGRSLLNELDRYAVAHNCNRMFLSTTPFLDRAIRLYERFGFRRTDEGPHDLFGTPLFTMEKVVSGKH